MSSPESGAPRLEPRAILLVLSAFGLFGAVFGVWLVLLAELQRASSLAPGALGLGLAAGLLLSLPVMSAAGRAVDRWGAGAVITGSAGAIGVALVGTAAAPTHALLMPFFLLFYSATAAYDVGINAAAIRAEQESGARVIGYFHAAFSGFTALSALVVGGLLASGVPFRLIYGGAALGAVGFAGVVWRVATLAPERSAVPAVSGGEARGLYRTPLVLLLAAVTALAFLVEGEVGNWVTIYLRSTLELPVFIGASGFVVFHSAMLVGRLAGARAVRRWGRWAALQLAGLTVASGMLLALSSGQTAPTLAGFLLVGLGLSVVAPTAYSLVGDAAGGRPGAASAVLTTVGYGGYLVGPVLVGGLAEVAGLRLALATILVAGVGISLLSTVGLSTVKRARAAPASSYRTRPPYRHL